MQLIVDANVVIAALIKPGLPADLFFKEELELVAPKLLFEEIKNNKELIVRKSRLSEEEINKFIFIFEQRIFIVPEEEFVRFKKKAEEICPDPKDVTYFALALYLNCPIWSNEKKLKEQPKVEVYATHELMKLLEEGHK